MSYTQLDRGHLIATVARLQERIRERFPSAGLLAVAGDLRAVVERHAARSASIRRPVWRLRLFSASLLAIGLGLVAWLAITVGTGAAGTTAATDWHESVQTIEAIVSMLFLLGAAAIFVASLELRHKRRRCLEALHELRALAHIVDLHQLTKDPDLALQGRDEAAAAEQPLPPFLLARYLDYCSEMLSLIGKVGALYAQDFPDPQAVDAVDDIEDLTTGLSRKIWQKIMILTSPGSGSAGA